MKFFTDLFETGKQTFESMPLSSRITSGLLLVAIVVSIGFLMQGPSGSSKAPILDGHVFTDADLQMAYKAFGSVGLSDFERDGNRILVPTAKITEYVKALADGNAFPSEPGNSVSEALDGGSMFENMATKERRIQEAQEKKISDFISMQSHVKFAYVVYDENREGFATNTTRTASVWVQPEGNNRLTDNQKRAIARSVQGAFAGLPYENISITDLSSGEMFSGDMDSMTPEQSQAYIAQRQYEQDLERKARNLLMNYGDVRIEARAVVDTKLREAVESIKYNEKPTTIATNSTTSESSSEIPKPSGRPGTPSNLGANQSASLAASVSKQTENQSQETERKIAGHEARLTENAGLQLVDASLSVSIPRSYYLIAWQRQYLELNPDAEAADVPQITADELKRLETDTKTEIKELLTTQLTPERPGGDRAERIVVNDYFDSPPPELPSPSFATMAGLWFASSWQSVGMFALAIVALVIMRSALKAPASADADKEFKRGFDVSLDDAFSQNEFSEQAPGETSDAESDGPKLQTTGGDTKEVISDLIKDDPSAAVNILRTWIGDAA